MTSKDNDLAGDILDEISRIMDRPHTQSYEDFNDIKVLFTEGTPAPATTLTCTEESFRARLGYCEGEIIDYLKQSGAVFATPKLKLREVELVELEATHTFVKPEENMHGEFALVKCGGITFAVGRGACQICPDGEAELEPVNRS